MIQTQNYKANVPYLLFYVITMGINGICIAYTNGGSNQTSGIFAAKLNWDAE
jgi:hypothetical protein